MRQQGDLQYFRPALCVVCKPNAKDATALCGRVNSWICINFAKNVQDNLARGFCHEHAQMCQILGMEFSLDPVLQPLTARLDHVERALSTRYHDAMTILQPQGKELGLLIVILPDNDGSLYGDQKQICETILGLINGKVGGRDTVLVDALSRRIPLVSNRPTIIFGADVTHPHPGEDSSPSIAVVSYYVSRLARGDKICWISLCLGPSRINSRFVYGLARSSMRNSY
ncbi:hypothetical protein ZIOFF_028604 [Zingiber officinale]|uniref:Piwi domain-containing protein n=1 Tax=Zingiber officinale TaxID=94328 RepID=A0A8J5GW77_ZINOF|nr:hypothetical protein ZIOFF_028604 [Zingiber officinale]